MIQNKTNVLTSTMVFSGILLADLGLVHLDPLCALVLGFFQFRGAFEVFQVGFLEQRSSTKLIKRQLAVCIGFLSCCIIFLFAQQVHGVLSRRSVVLIPARWVTADGPVSPLLGRAEYFYIIDTKKQTSILLNNSLRTFHGDVSDNLVDIVRMHGVGVVVAQRVGVEIFADLSAENVRIYLCRQAGKCFITPFWITRLAISMLQGPLM